MRRILGQTFALGLLALLPACSGSSSGGVTRAGDFQVALCSLGCQGGSCAVNQIATNQDIVFTFNDDVDPASVSFTSLSVVEVSNGSTPPGEFVVDGRKLIFRPSLIESQAGISFGFAEGSVYRVTLFAAPESNVVKSVIGRPNLSPISCAISTDGVIDLVPGRPTVSFTPNATSPPNNSNFSINMVFNDLMQKDQLVDPVTGGSPSISVKVVDDSQPGSSVEVDVPGTFTISFDQNKLTTRLVFTPLAPFPGGQGGLRKLRLDFSSQIADIADNFLANPGSNFIALPDRTSVPGSFAESFDDTGALDVDGSTQGLWSASPGVLASGHDAVNGVHLGGGSGLLGVFAPTDDFTFDTDNTTLTTVTGESWTITDGVFMFEEIHIPVGVTVSAVGSNPLRLYSRGACVVEGTLDLAGAPAPANFGKYFPRFDELLAGESTGGIFPFEAEGGQPANGRCSGGSGGKGGESWYLVDGDPPPGLPPFEPVFFDEDKTSWVEGQIDPVNDPPDPTRFLANTALPPNGGRWVTIHGATGEGVGGATTDFPGDPELRPDFLAPARDSGAGMGSWAWPPVAGNVPDLGYTTLTPIKAHFDPGTSSYLSWAWHRSRGGGGGGFWTEGKQGEYFVPGSTDPLLNPLQAPVVDAPNGVWEYNDFLDIDAIATTPVGIADAAGGAYVLPAGIETLDPEQDLLLGGGGGGGAGCGMYGSYHDGGFQADGLIDTFRTSTGAGGGAGGGALQVHAGGRVAVSGVVTVRGGAGGDSEFMLSLPYSDPAAINVGPPGDAGGGGGAGGSILLQTSGDLTVAADALRLDGGRGGKGSAGNPGGKGGSGLIRFETRTGGESLAALQGMVSPDEAVELTPIGQPGLPNLVQHQADFPAALGDFGVFNGNASGVRSHWFVPSNDVLIVDFTGYEITVRYDDGSEQVVVYDGDEASGNASPAPGVTPIWVGFQVGWGGPGKTEPDPNTIGDWVIPGYNTTTGMNELRSNLARMVRFQIVFDHDQIAALIGSGAGRYFQVEDVKLYWNGE